MTPEQKAALVQSQTVCCLVELESMRARNMHDLWESKKPTYGESDFKELLKRYEFGIGWNPVLELFQRDY